MDKAKQDLINVNAVHERTIRKNEKLRRNQEEQGRDMGPRNRFPDQNTAGLNEKDNKNEIEDLYREMQDLQWGE